jgi:hypothetical protein
VVDRGSQDGSKWVVIPADGSALTTSDYSRITKYDKDNCVFDEGDGTSVQCSAFSPYHMGFSTIQPDDKDGTLGYDVDGEFTTGSGITYRVPLGYEVFNKRAQLSKCYWWDGNIEEFSVASGTGDINDIAFNCTHADTGYVNSFNAHRYDDVNRLNIAPCNGAKPECKYYTGVCWRYCVDEKMRQGDKVLAEQILELRYYLRRDRWDAVKFNNAFKDAGYIYGWEGSVDLSYQSGSVVNWSIPSTKTYISDFDTFEIERELLRLTAGTADQTALPDYPTLVEELKSLPLRPIIRNRFYKDPDNNHVSTFEASSLDHDSILIVGDSFYTDPTYAINLSDPDLKYLANEIRTLLSKKTGSEKEDNLIDAVNVGTAEFSAEDGYYEGMAEIESGYKIAEEFAVFYNRFDTAIQRVLTYWPEKVAMNELDASSLMFSIDVSTVWGENIILVLNKGSGTWEFDLLNLYKVFCGGVIAQTAFLLLGESGKTINYLPAYEQDFFAHTNSNGIINFKFEAFGNERQNRSADVSYIYNDYAYQVPHYNPALPPDNETYHIGYTTYKIKLDITDDEITEENIRFFGNAGYAIVEIPDPNDKLSSIVKDWTISGSLNLTTTDIDGVEEIIEMEVVEKCTDRLEINQMIIKPKTIAEFSQPCDAALSFGGVYYYEKRSFDETPDATIYEEFTEGFLSATDNAVRIDSASLEGSGTSYSLTEFGRYTLLISVVYKGKITGKIKGVTRTKMLTWVRQPYCRDVEITYNWGADYQKSQLTGQNEDVCWGEKKVKIEPNLVVEGYSPPCGDHDLSAFSGKGPMWYPYDACDEVAVYPTDQLTSRVTSLVNRPMEIFSPALMALYGEEVNHGSHDMRMLGPQDSFGYVCGVHASIWACTCDWSYCNKTKVGENRFTGGGRYRCDLDAAAKVIATRYGGELPNFGNPVRDFLRSYRTIDNAFYYNTQGLRSQKWMPMYYFYTKADLTANVGGAYPYPYELYTKDLSSTFIHPMGLYLAEGSIEGVDISEKIDVDVDNKPKRYYFEEVFDTHRSSSIRYPSPVDSQLAGSSFILTWYTYKDYPGGTSRSIQWAWQEIWTPIERGTTSTEILLGEDLYGHDVEAYSNQGSLSTEDSVEIEEIIVARPFTDNRSGGVEYLEGPFLFCDVEYPPYQYDAEIGEHRLVVEEDNYTLVLTAPERNDDGSYANTNFYLSLVNDSGGAGPARSFKANGNWDTDADHTYYDLYTTCTTSPWVSDVTLFGYGYTNITTAQAVTDGRMISTYDDVGDEVKTYYQRGLDVSLDTSKFIYLPREKTKMDSSTYEVEFSKTPTYLEDEDNPLGAIVPGEEYPTSHCWEIGYTNLDGTVDFIFHFDNKDETRTVDRIVLICKFGNEVLEEDVAWRLFHRPAVEIAHSDAGIIYTTMFTTSSMVLADNEDDLTDQKVIIDYNLAAANVVDPHDKWRLRLRVNPTSDEVSRYGIGDYYNESENIVFIKCIYVYDTQFVDAEETIGTWERLYNISYGKYGNFPPFGYESTGSLLYPATHETSTVYQRDTFAGGVVGIAGTYGEQETMDKVRGRLMFETHQDKEPLPSSTLARMEAEQKNVYDAIAVKEGSTSFSLKAVIPPGFSEKLSEAGATYPELWRCDFLNSIILPLTPVTQYDPYSAAGQYWDWDFSNFHVEPRCAGSQFGVFTVGAKEVFEYVLFSRYDPSVSWTPEEAVVVYYNTIGKVLVDSWSYLESQFAGSEEVSERIRTETGHSNPGPITPY